MLGHGVSGYVSTRSHCGSVGASAGGVDLRSLTAPNTLRSLFQRRAIVCGARLRWLTSGQTRIGWERGRTHDVRCMLSHVHDSGARSVGGGLAFVVPLTVPVGSPSRRAVTCRAASPVLRFGCLAAPVQPVQAL